MMVSAVAGDSRVGKFFDGLAMVVLGLSIWGFWKWCKRLASVWVKSEAEKRLDVGLEHSQVAPIDRELHVQAARNREAAATVVILESPPR